MPCPSKLSVVVFAVATCILAGVSVAAAQEAGGQAALTLIPPSPVTNQITLDVRAGVYNRGERSGQFDVAFYVDEETADRLLHRTTIDVGAKSSRAVACRWPTREHVGQHKVLLVVRSGKEIWRAVRPLKVIASDVRSTRTIDGAWIKFHHGFADQGQTWNEVAKRMTDAQWAEHVRAMHELGMDVVVIWASFHSNMRDKDSPAYPDGYRGQPFYPSRLYPKQKTTAAKDPLEAVFSEADTLGMYVFPALGLYAWFSYSPPSLQWHKAVATELWERYGHHPSFYGWYVAEECNGDLGGSAAAQQQIVDFFRELQAHCRTMAPDKPLMLAPNASRVPRARDAYRKLLKYCDILCPFAFHRQPKGDVGGPAAARLLQTLCDETGAHLWHDLEVFDFGPTPKDPAGKRTLDPDLWPRPMNQVVRDLRQYDHIEKVLCYRYTGIMNAPWASARPQPEGADTVAYFRQYQQYLRGDWPETAVKHLAIGKPLALANPYDSRYPGGGDKSLTDGQLAFASYQDRTWQGYKGADLVATVDLERSVPIRQIRSRYLQEVTPGVLLPRQVEYAVSTDGRDFRIVAALTHEVSPKTPGPLVREFTADLKDTQARYVRVRARNFGTLPDGHSAKGKTAWLFANGLAVQ